MDSFDYSLNDNISVFPGYRAMDSNVQPITSFLKKCMKTCQNNGIEYPQKC